MKIYGLTGGIASGKSTVARALRALGATVIDADELSRVVVEPGKPAYEAIRARWPQVMGADGVLDRAKLGDIVFGDAGQRSELNAIVHPRVAEESARRMREAEQRGDAIVFYEAALLVENGLAEAFDGLIVVTVPEEIQVARLRGRDQIGEAPARARIAAQLPLQDKVKRATWVIDNSTSPDDTTRAAQRLYRELHELGTHELLEPPGMKSAQTTYFVTGFPGFISRRLVPALLQRSPGARVFLLVQPRHEARAKTEIAKLPEEAAFRTTIFTGDVVDMHLGLASTEYRTVTNEVTDIFHLAALYSHGSDAKALQQINVDGTRNVLEIATEATQLRRLNHMSTTTVAGARLGVIAEDELDEGQRFHTAYEESKFQSELLVQRMRSRLPVSIYRPGIVVGDSRTGEIDRFDGPYYLAIMLVMAPSGVPLPVPGNMVAPLNVVPIDFVIDAVLHIAHDPRGVGKTFHIVDPNPMAARRVYEWIAAHTGKKLPSIRIDHRVADRLLRMPFLERLAREERAAIASVNNLAIYSSANTLELLDGTGIRCPRLSTYLDRLISYVREHYEERRTRTTPEPEAEDPLR